MTTGRSPTVTRSDDGVLTVAIDGDFDMAATFAVEPALEQALEMPGLRRLTLDLSGLSFIDSVGIGVIIQLAADLEARAIPLRIVPGPRHVQRVFTTIGMADVLPFDPAA